MLFGGETLQDFAFALLIGIASGTYSSIFIATPVLQHWKEREPGFRARLARITGGARARPAVRHRGAGRPDRRDARRRAAAAGISAPPGQEVSASEFQEMVRDLGVEEADAGAAQPAAHRRAEPPRRRPTRTRPRRRRRRVPPADARRLRRQRRGRPTAKERKPRNSRHGRPR